MSFAAPYIIRPANDFLDKHPAIKSLAKQMTDTYAQHH